ncbi:MAG: hypothetical protein GWN79_29150 [Actinobacteria bacterium]|nr:hypothetical protein [Actinomycetota bacterium]NIS37396.1 hypothetical protein [Actinomycetota bacterium]NIT99260.1 hypothetical protein [Actinomycetota bacterium]NIU22858.1 hypothetical protein [Actinomycetota bacterium]NIU71826.1 hypothetical protein [Actinomycetota bacterium]
MSDDLEQALAETRAELERLRLTLDVVGTVDLEVGILNENGIVDAVERCRRWQDRRGDVFGVLAVVLPSAGRDAGTAADVAATIAAGLREVDDVGRLAPDCFVGVLSDLVAGSLDVVADRIGGVVGRLGPAAAGCTIGGVEVRRADLHARTILERAVELGRSAPPGEPGLETLGPED